MITGLPATHWAFTRQVLSPFMDGLIILQQPYEIDTSWSHFTDKLMLREAKQQNFFFFLRFYLFIHENTQRGEREAEIQAEGEAGSMQGARHGTRSQVSRIRPWVEDSAKLLSHLGCPLKTFLL